MDEWTPRGVVIEISFESAIRLRSDSVQGTVVSTFVHFSLCFFHSFVSFPLEDVCCSQYIKFVTYLRQNVFAHCHDLISIMVLSPIITNSRLRTCSLTWL